MDNYNTPSWLMKVFDDWHDPCPFFESFKVDGLKEDWKDKTFVNPPYSNPLPWVEKAIEESKKGKTIVMLLKMDSSTKWFSKLIEVDAKMLWCSKRLRFDSSHPAPFPSVLVIL